VEFTMSLQAVCIMNWCCSWLVMV